MRPKYDGAGAVDGLAGDAGVAEDDPEAGVAAGPAAFLGPEARRKDHGGMKLPLDLRGCLVSSAKKNLSTKMAAAQEAHIRGPVMMGAISGTEVPEDLRVLVDVFWKGLDRDNEGRGEEL